MNMKTKLSDLPSVIAMEKLALEESRENIRRAGGVPNHRFFRALRAVHALECELDKPRVKPKGSYFNIVATNGRTFKDFFVPEKSNIYAETAAQGIEIASFSPVL